MRGIWLVVKEGKAAQNQRPEAGCVSVVLTAGSFHSRANPTGLKCRAENSGSVINYPCLCSAELGVEIRMLHIFHPCYI